MTLDKVRLEIGAAITAARGAGLGKMAAATGIPKTTLARIEAGEPSLTVERARLIADAVGVSVADVFNAVIKRSPVTPTGRPNALARDASAALAEIPMEHVIVVMRLLVAAGAILPGDDQRRATAAVVDGPAK